MRWIYRWWVGPRSRVQRIYRGLRGRFKEAGLLDDLVKILDYTND